MNEALPPRSPARDDARPAAIARWLVAFVVSWSLGSLIYAVAAAPGEAPGGVDGLMRVYADVALQLPPSERIGFISLIADPKSAGIVAYSAQNALAPRLLDRDLSSVALVITTPDAPRSVDDAPRLRGFALVGTSAGGIRIYQRRE